MEEPEKDSQEEKIKEAFENVEVESLLNRETGELPFAYFHPQTEGRLTWKCGYDAEGKITSIFHYEGQGRPRCQYLDSKEKAEMYRDELIKNGWQKLKPPKVTFTYPGQKEGKPLNRKQKRFLRRKLKKLAKKDPFQDQQG